MKFIGFLFMLCVVLAVANAKRIENQVPIPAESARLERHAEHHHGHHHGEHVDFGAHTGDHGSFGWYADFPVHTDH